MQPIASFYFQDFLHTIIKMNKFAAAISLMMVACVLMGEAMPNRRRSQGGAANAHGDHPVEESGTVISDHEKLSESLSAHERGLDELRALLQGESSRRNVSICSS